MKKNPLCLMLALFPGILAAQSVTPDAAFGLNGTVVSGLYGMSGHPLGIDFAVLPDGKTILGGSRNGTVGLEKYDNTGALDLSFSTSLLESDGLEVGVSGQKDGKVLLVSENAHSLSTFVARMDQFGHLDPGFGIDGIAQTFVSHFLAHNVAEQQDGKVLVFGDEWTNFSSFSVLRFLSDGTRDASFATNGKLSIDLPDFAHEVPVAVAEQGDHKLVFAGSIGYPTWNVLLVRINPDGTRDATFGDYGVVIDSIKGSSDAYALAIQADGKIVVSGTTNLPAEAFVARYNTDGSHDLGFGGNGVQYLNKANEGIGVAVKPDGKILTANWSSDNNLGNLVLAQFLPNGQKDLSFGENGIFRMIAPGMHPRALSLVDNKATVSARKLTGTTLKQLFRFILDLNVGTLHPDEEPVPSLWVYPNPIAEQFTLEFGLKQQEHVSIQLFDMNGKQVQSFIQNQPFEQGEHSIQLSCADQLAAGDYVLTLEVAGKRMTSIQILKK